MLRDRKQWSDYCISKGTSGDMVFDILADWEESEECACSGKEYLVCEKQKGEGCDYTIGCGMRFYFIEADSIQDAIESVVFPYGEDGWSALEGENALEKILIIPAAYVKVVDVTGIANEIEETRKREAADAQKSRELAELRRLQAKYDVG
jgi:hypothetical protein